MKPVPAGSRVAGRLRLQRGVRRRAPRIPGRSQRVGRRRGLARGVPRRCSHGPTRRSREARLLFRGGASAGFHINPTCSAVAFVEAAKVPGIEMAQVAANNIPLIPYEPAITGGLGIQARFGGPKATSSRRTATSTTRRTARRSRSRLLADLSGTVVDEAGKPVVGAQVTFTLKNSQVPATATDARVHGRSRACRSATRSTASRRSTTLRSRSPSRSTGRSRARRRSTSRQAVRSRSRRSARAVAAARPDERRRAHVGGQADRGRGDHGPGEQKTETAADGTFALDLPPGQYKVTAKAAARRRSSTSRSIPTVSHSRIRPQEVTSPGSRWACCSSSRPSRAASRSRRSPS